MIRITKKAVKVIKSLLTILLILNFYILHSFAITPEIQQKQVQADEITQQLQDLEIKQEAAVEKLNKAELELGVTEEKLRVNERELEDAMSELQDSQKVLGKRIRQVYEQGQAELVDVLFSAKSFNELISTLDFYSLIATSDAKIIKSVKMARQKLAAAKEKLETVKDKQFKITNELADQKAVIDEKQKEKHNLLSKVKDQIAYLRQKEEEEIRRVREEALKKINQNQQDYQGLPSTTSDVIAFAQKFLGTPYVWGGKDPSGFDCSGFVLYVYNSFNVSLPRVANDQMNFLYGKGRGVTDDSLQPGDLVFYGGSGYATHVVIYMGQGYVIGASGGQYTGGEVKIAPIDYRSDRIGAGRP